MSTTSPFSQVISIVQRDCASAMCVDGWIERERENGERERARWDAARSVGSRARGLRPGGTVRCVLSREGGKLRDAWREIFDEISRGAMMTFVCCCRLFFLIYEIVLIVTMRRICPGNLMTFYFFCYNMVE